MKFLFPTILIVLAILVFYTFTMPLLDNVNKLRAESATVNEALVKARELIAVREQKKKERNNFPEDTRKRLEKFLPDNVDNVRLIIDLIARARSHGLEIKNPQIVDSPKTSLGIDTGEYGSVDLSFGVTGSYEVFQLFLEDLERSLRLLDVISLNFISGDREAYDFTLTVRTYWLK